MNAENMKKYSVFILLCFCIAFPAFAQPTFKFFHLPGGGAKLLLRFVSDAAAINNDQVRVARLFGPHITFSGH